MSDIVAAGMFDKPPLSDSDLRTRIAAALYDHWWHGTMTLKEPPAWEKLSESARESWLNQADAVIRELGLTVERWTSSDPVVLRARWGKPTVHTRYVTDWEADIRALEERRRGSADE